MKQHTSEWLDVYYKSLIDSLTSKALLFGMWGNKPMAAFFENMAKFAEKQFESLKKDK